MTAFLTQDLADALCTIITVGYIHEDGNKTAFQYQDAVASPEQISYSAVAKALSAYNVALNVTQSPSQQVSPFIVAKTPKVPNFDAAAFINTDYWRYIQKIMSTANKLDNPPKGAYIGGMSSISKLNIVGPSTIVQVPVRYRNVDDATMSKRYQSAVDGSNLALSCLQNTGAALPKGMGVDTTLMPKPIPTPATFAQGTVYASYHGMILAMAAYGTNADNNTFIFEIALGKETSKVSSCLACSIFMTANGTPPTSTHLGRCDHWNIPPNALLAQVSNWRKKISDSYTAGKLALGANPTVKSAVATIEKAIGANAAAAQIPDVFLEALTFTDDPAAKNVDIGKFTAKIIKTLKPA